MWAHHRRTLRRLCFLVLVLCAGSALADDALVVGRRVEITLADGTKVQGTVTAVDASTVSLESSSLGTVSFARDDIDNVGVVTTSGVRWQDPDPNSLVFTPTSETLPAGTVYYRNFLLLFNNFGIALTDDVNLSGMFSFPITGDVTLGSIGVKARLVSREESPVGLAVAGNIFLAEDVSVSTITGIVSVGDVRKSLNAAINVVFGEDDSEVVLVAGGDVQVSRRSKLLLEFATSESAIDDDVDLRGIVNFGFRVFWDEGSFSLTGFRPLTFDDDFLAFPMAQVSIHF